MGVVLKVIDIIVLIFSLILTINTLVLTGQVFLPSKLFPKFLRRVYKWYCDVTGDYMFIEKPAFFKGVAVVEAFLQFPLIILNVYAIFAGTSWYEKTLLMYGASSLSGTVPMLADMIISHRFTWKLKLIYLPFAAFSVLAIVRGWLSDSSQLTVR